MYCPNCGAQNEDSSKFCTSCGAQIVSQKKPSANPSPTQSQESRKMQLRCKACGGTLEVDRNSNVLSCPFCGSKELIAESDKVTVERIRNNTKKDLVFGVMDRVNESKQQKIEEKRRKEAEDREQLKKIMPILLIVIVLGIIFCCIMAAIEDAELYSEPVSEYYSSVEAYSSTGSHSTYPLHSYSLIISSMDFTALEL